VVAQKAEVKHFGALHGQWQNNGGNYMAKEQRLIDANLLHKRLSELGAEPNYQHDGEDWGVGVCMSDSIVDEVPTVEATEVVHAQWIPASNKPGINIGMKCSRCRSRITYSEFYNGNRKYCHKCGAKMDG
jgi:hypothetical protein